MASIEIKDGQLVVHIHGWDKFLALRSTLTIPLAEVKSVTAHPIDAKYDDMAGLRVAGGYWPGSFAAGYFWVTGTPASDRAHALAKIDEARGLLANTPDEGSFRASDVRGHLDAASRALKEGLTAAGLPVEAKYLAFYDVHDPAKTVGLDVEHGRLRRVVVEIDNETVDEAVARVRAALATTR